MSTDTDDLTVKTRHKRKLAQIREKAEIQDVNNSGREEGIPFDRRDSETTERDLRPDSQAIEGELYPVRPGNEGMENGAGAARGYDQGIRQTDTAAILADPGIDRGSESFGESQLTPEEKKERERVLATQRKQRQRDREKEERDYFSQYINTESGSNRDSDRDREKIETVTPIDSASRFKAKLPFVGKHEDPEKSKLFTEKEAKNEKERLAFIYAKGSGLLDDILEIIVKGHEPVQIWQFDDGEADMLAEMHLERAKHDKEAARSARILLALYDQLFKIELIGPRLFATGRLVKQKGGFSFR